MKWSLFSLDFVDACEYHAPRKDTAMHPSPNQIKQRLHQQGYTLKSWAALHGFKYRTVSDVVRGLRRGHFGEGREVRQRLGLPPQD